MPIVQDEWEEGMMMTELDDILARAKARWPQLDAKMVKVVTTGARCVEFPCVFLPDDGTLPGRGLRTLVMEPDESGMDFAEGPGWQVLVVRHLTTAPNVL